MKKTEKTEKKKTNQKPPRHELAGPDMRHPGVELAVFGGYKMTFRPPVMIDPYKRFGVLIEGLSPIVGPCAPDLTAWNALVGKRLKDGKLSVEAHDRLLEEARGKQVQRMESDANGDAAGKIVEEMVKASVNTFARDMENRIVLQSYAFRAATRECLQRSGFFQDNSGSRERFKHGLGIWPLAIPILRDDQPLADIDDIHVEHATDSDRIASQPVHVWAQNKMQHSISQFEVIEPPWRMRILIEVQRNLEDDFEGTVAEAETDGQDESVVEEAKKLAKKGERKVRMLGINPADIVQALGLLPTIALGAKRSMGYGRCRVIGVTEFETVDPSDPYPFDWRIVRGF